MKLQKNLLWGVAATALLTGCIDDKYDLADIDTTSEFKINDLVLPVNLDPVTLSDIIHVKEGEKLKEVTINDETFYAVEQSGDFKSDGIKVNDFSASPEPMNEKIAVFTPNASTRVSGKRNADGFETYFLFEAVEEDLIYDTKDPIDGSIRDLTQLNYRPLTFSIMLTTSGMPAAVNSELVDVLLEMPKGMTVTEVRAGGKNYPVSTYEPSTGNLTLGTVALIDNKTVIEVISTGMSMTVYDHPFKYDPVSDSGSFHLESVFNIRDCRLKLNGPLDAFASLNEIVYNVHYDLGTLNATSILGSIAYDLTGTGLDIDPIDLTDMPSFLEDPETNLMLTNPQIYLQLKNPVGKYGLSYQSEVNIKAHREADVRNFMSPLVKVPAVAGDYNYLLAEQPQKVTNLPAFYAPGLERLAWNAPGNNLGDILAGEGLPQMLDVVLYNPCIPEQKLSSPFQLNQEIEGMEGEYMFLAPLALKEDSQIVKTLDGWWSEDLSGLNIDYLTLTMDATNGLPTGVLLNVYAINELGDQISTEKSIKLEMNAVNAPLEITLTGKEGETFNNIDGIKIYVMMLNNSEQPLAPDQVITLENLKAKVSGNYTKEL